MSISQSLLPEFDQEMASTRRVLERIPTEKWNWKPHERSGTLGWLASHVGTVPGWYTMTLQTENLDYAPVDGPQYEPPKIEDTQQLLAAFDKESSEARAALSKASDAELGAVLRVVAAQAGTYEISGGTLTLRPIVAMNPRRTHPGTSATLSFKLEGNTLVLTQKGNEQGPAANPMMTKLTRVE